MFEYEKNVSFELILSYHGNTGKIIICLGKIFYNLKIHNLWYLVILLCKAETAEITYNLSSKLLKIVIFCFILLLSGGSHKTGCPAPLLIKAFPIMKY